MAKYCKRVELINWYGTRIIKCQGCPTGGRLIDQNGPAIHRFTP
ncbi:hypothetical protein CCACVL1_23985 [Corchorus capsularis]|uniref:Uncharacterized protein n=1 Tax=Corchorus capsularis TaxID=210143 RepID=A0A1R3GRA9_COCAP|nr:hypothetical protein CCACVL1_23985 [Corchorus capsularis]